MDKTLYILGAGGHGKVIADAAKKMKRWQTIYFLDDNRLNATILGIEVIDKFENTNKYLHKYAEFFIAIGDNQIRSHLQTQLKNQGHRIATIIHPNAYIAEEVVIGEGTVVVAGAVINPLTVIGKGCIINTSASIDHDSVIENFVHISPGVRLAGNVKIQSKSWIGTNTTVINNVSITDNCIIGAHSLVLTDIEQSGSYVGNPVRKIR